MQRMTRIKRVLTAFTLFVIFASQAWADDKGISFFNPDDWVQLICHDLERPNKEHLFKDIAVRSDLTAVYNFIDVIDNCERKQFNLICRQDTPDLTYEINRMTGYMFIYSDNGTRMYKCEKIEKVF